MTIKEFLEQVCNMSVDEDELVYDLYKYGLAIFDVITVTTPGGIVLIGEEL